MAEFRTHFEPEAREAERPATECPRDQRTTRVRSETLHLRGEETGRGPELGGRTRHRVVTCDDEESLCALH